MKSIMDGAGWEKHGHGYRRVGVLKSFELASVGADFIAVYSRQSK